MIFNAPIFMQLTINPAILFFQMGRKCIKDEKDFFPHLSKA
jgi:hypothetical protein